MGAPNGQQIDIVMVFWLVRGGGHTILFDCGCHRQKWLDDFHLTDFLSPEKVLKDIGVDPASVTDIIVSHAHWDHMGGIDLFPNATIWIQKGEYEYYTGAAWQTGGHHGGIDADDILELVRRNQRGASAFRRRRRPRDSARHSRVHRSAAHLRIPVHPRRGRPSLCACLRQLLLVPEPQLPPRRRNFRSGRSDR